MGPGTSDSILGVIQVTVWVRLVHFLILSLNKSRLWLYFFSFVGSDSLKQSSPIVQNKSVNTTALSGPLPCWFRFRPGRCKVNIPRILETLLQWKLVSLWPLLASSSKLSYVSGAEADAWGRLWALPTNLLQADLSELVKLWIREIWVTASVCFQVTIFDLVTLESIEPLIKAVWFMC